MAPSTTRIVIVGGGIAGVPLAYELKSRLHGRAEVTVVSDSPSFHFVPANPWVALGLRASEDVTFALEPLLTARKIALHVAALVRIDLERSRLELGDGASLEYDALVIATGICPNWTRIPGAEGNPHVHSVIRPSDAVAARSAYEAFLAHPGPVIVAAAPRVPTLGPLYEYAFLLDADLRRRALRPRVPITLVTPEPYPGHVGLDKPVAREELTRAMKAQGIGWIGNAALHGFEGTRLDIAVHESSVERTQQAAGPAREPAEAAQQPAEAAHRPAEPAREPAPRSLEFSYAVIWPPFRGIEAVAGCKLLCDEDGLVVVDEYLRARGQTNVFAIGACTAKPLLTHTAIPVGAPDAVYVIQQQVAIVAANVAHSLRGEPLNRASIEREQWIADMGKRGAAYLTAPQMPLRQIQWLHQGSWMYEAKREFEDYFINQILFGTGPHGQVPALVQRLRSRPGRGAGSHPHAALGAQLSLSIDTRRTLEALARQLDIDATAFSRQLLEKAVSEALSCLDPPMREQVRTDVHARLVEELRAKDERVRFEGGAP